MSSYLPKLKERKKGAITRSEQNIQRLSDANALQFAKSQNRPVKYITKDRNGESHERIIGGKP